MHSFVQDTPKDNMKQNRAVSTLFSLYDLCWKAAIPFLKKNSRIADGFQSRMLSCGPVPEARIWIQSASAGEAFLTWEILKHLDITDPLTILLTTGTRQGMDTLEKAAEDMHATRPGMTIHTSFFPFDRPGLMEKAVSRIRPELMILVELEVWPGLLRALKNHGCRTLVLNGRLTDKSLNRYLIWPALWQDLAPDKICAISETDARRFKTLFPGCQVRVVPNIKFDRLPRDTDQEASDGENPLTALFNTNQPIIVLGSVRQEEEDMVEKIIEMLHSHIPDGLIFLFPRHMHRIDHWSKRLTAMGLSWTLRSGIKTSVSRVILWDAFGELAHAYRMADAAFVGGSLAPLGGQNFLEALASGVIPVSGPSWDNFSWVGQDIVKKGLLDIGENWKQVADKLLNHASGDTGPGHYQKTGRELSQPAEGRDKNKL